ncbi:helix-turn-helix domain-containing protein, partial [Bifidobacterium longum]|nr:helix-turn-helix domain-containing protein [Bifidobacterium longum]MDB6601022.1 helix-turn-helix domain-containing protein [Bifidobacterium longum]MDB6801585.1 helix-turn-helix domain-containing protein [Bifidobacterium longum]
MGEVYSHLSEEERQVIQIEVGNGASIRGIGAMLGRSPSSISREIKRNTWFPSNENESYRPYRPKRLKAGPWTGRYYIAGPAQRKADRRRSKPRKPYRLSHDRLWCISSSRCFVFSHVFFSGLGSCMHFPYFSGCAEVFLPNMR